MLLQSQRMLKQGPVCALQSKKPSGDFIQNPLNHGSLGGPNKDTQTRKKKQQPKKGIERSIRKPEEVLTLGACKGGFGLSQTKSKGQHVDLEVDPIQLGSFMGEDGFIVDIDFRLKIPWRSFETTVFVESLIFVCLPIWCCLPDWWRL